MARIALNDEVWGVAHRQGRLVGGKSPLLFKDADGAAKLRESYATKDDLVVVKVAASYVWQDRSI